MDLRPFQCAQFLGGLKLLKLGNFLLKTRPGRPKTSVTKANIAAVKIVVEQDARLSVKDIASCTGISEGNVQTILKKRLDLRKVCARWVPHLCNQEQKTQCLKCARELLKTYKGCNSRIISKNGKRKVQGVPQSQTAALSRPQEEEKTNESKQAQIEQTYEKH